MIRDTSLYLKVGDRVYHKRYLRWGMGVVVEERSSQLPGGFCYVRIRFQDGNMRVFDNNYRSDCCCYYAGIVKMEEKPEYREVAEKRSRNTSLPKRKALTKGKS